MQEIFQNLVLKNLIWSAVFIIAAFVIWFVIKRFRDSLLKKVTGEMKEDVQRRAAITTTSSVMKYVLILLTILTVLSVNGVNVSSIIASLGIAGAVAGLAWQDMFKDLIQGLRIVSDNFFSVGDYVVYKGNNYRVVELSMRTTRFESMVNKDIVVECNRNITEITRISGLQYINVPVPYETDSGMADEVLTEAAETIRKLPGVKGCKYIGLKSFEDSYINYLIELKTEPYNIISMRRQAMRKIREAFVSRGIEVPYQQIDIHQK